MGVEKKGCVMMILGLLLWTSYLASTVFGETYEYEFVIARTNYTRLCNTKNILTVNGLYPGPTLNVTRGDIVNITAINNADHNITLHWHGLKQPRDPWHDGPEFITQCPIKPGSKFKYVLNFTTEEGTIWWHAHSDWTRATVHGAIHIYPPTGRSFPYKPDSEVTLIIGEWWNRDIFAVQDDALTYGGEVNVSNAYTINGQPGDLYNCSKNGTFRFKVQQNKTYLLRVINAALQVEHFFAVANHNVTVVGEDGSYCKPLTTSYIMITPGQTYDLLLTANQTSNLYYMAASPYSSGQGVGFGNSTTTAILEYDDYTPENNTTPIFPDLPLYNDTSSAIRFVTQLRSIASTDHPADVPPNVTRHLIYAVSVNTLACPTCEGPNGTRLAASVNNISFDNPSVDILQAYYFNNFTLDKDFPSEPPYFYNFTGNDFPDNVVTPTAGTKVMVLEYDSKVQLVLQGTNVIAGENHPVHLHGQNFFVVGIGFGNFNASEDPNNFNLVDPPQKNTVGVPKNGWVALRFRAQNPGVWFMHCHLERHLSWGMDAVFITSEGNTSYSKMLPPPDDMPSC